MFKKIRNPFLFQGHKKKKHYFEGWYYKMVTKDQLHSLALIPGISLNEEDSHSFIQVFYTEKKDKDNVVLTDYISYPIDDFSFEKKQKQVLIGENIFSMDGMTIHIENDQLNLVGKIHINEVTPIKTSLLSPSIMGFFGYIRNMECNHGVISMTHNLAGSMILNGKIIDFKGGKGYIEKDWGKSFPKEYVWMQSNHFKKEVTSFMLSYATIPFLFLEFKGLIASLIVGKKEYRFATYNFAKIDIIDITENYVKYSIKKGKYELIIEALNDETTLLKSPKRGMMNETIKEGLSGKIKLELKHKGETIIKDKGFHAGLEIMM